MAGQVEFLFQRSDFRALVEEAARQLGIANPAVVEKDYFVTETLRRIALTCSTQVIFKGGTSLSKGWNLIERFSEDIDLFVEPGPNEAQTAERLAAAAESAMSFPGFVGRNGRTDKGNASWVEEFVYETRLSEAAAIRPVVLLEAGIQSADQPVETVFLSSMLGLLMDRIGAPIETADRGVFPMRLLHFRRTFVEKLFTLHSRVERSIRQSKSLGRDARHYYDLAMLGRQTATLSMLESEEYRTICWQYRALTKTHFPGQVKYLPSGMNLHDSRALFPDGELRESLSAAYLQEAQTLCYGWFPAFDEVLSGFERIRSLLKVDLEPAP